MSGDGVKDVSGTLVVVDEYVSAQSMVGGKIQISIDWL